MVCRFFPRSPVIKRQELSMVHKTHPNMNLTYSLFRASSPPCLRSSHAGHLWTLQPNHVWPHLGQIQWHHLGTRETGQERKRCFGWMVFLAPIILEHLSQEAERRQAAVNLHTTLVPRSGEKAGSCKLAHHPLPRPCTHILPCPSPRCELRHPAWGLGRNKFC